MVGTTRFGRFRAIVYRAYFRAMWSGEHRSQGRSTGKQLSGPLVSALVGFVIAVGTGTASVADVNSPKASLPNVSDKIVSSLLDHPAIQTSRARICQAVYRLGIQHAEARPQISGQINSDRQLLKNFKSSNNNPGERDSAEARGLSRQESNVYDLELIARHTLWDWHVTDNRIKAHQNAYDVERLRLQIALSEQALSLLKSALRLDLYGGQVAHAKQAIVDMTPYIEAIEAQGEAGFVRLVDVRRSRLVLLDEEIRLREAETAYDQTVEDIHNQFGLNPEDAAEFLSRFKVARPLDLLEVEPETADLVRSIELQIRQSVYDFESISAELYPVLGVTVNATAFDLGDFENEYEVTGQVSVSMPLYDGGTNKARRSEASWRMRELGQDKRREIRDLGLDVAQVSQQFADTQDKIAEFEERLAAQQSRLDSLKVLTESSDVPRLSLAEAVSEMTQIRFELLNNQITLDALRSDNLHQADQLISVLNLSVGERTC